MNDVYSEIQIIENEISNLSKPYLPHAILLNPNNENAYKHIIGVLIDVFAEQKNLNEILSNMLRSDDWRKNIIASSYVIVSGSDLFLEDLSYRFNKVSKIESHLAITLFFVHGNNSYKIFDKIADVALEVDCRDVSLVRKLTCSLYSLSMLNSSTTEFSITKMLTNKILSDQVTIQIDKSLKEMKYMSEFWTKNIHIFRKFYSDKHKNSTVRDCE